MPRLVSAAAEAGVDAATAKAFLSSGELDKPVRRLLDYVRAYGIKTIPTLFVGGRYVISGAVEAEVVLDALRQAAANERDARGRRFPDAKPASQANAWFGFPDP